MTERGRLLDEITALEIRLRALGLLEETSLPRGHRLLDRLNSSLPVGRPLH